MTEPPSLSLGLVLGGWAADPRWEGAVKGIALRVVDLCDGVESPLSVNVVFQVPGHLARPEFTGVRTGRFSARDRWLLVQVALPDQAGEDPAKEVRASLLSAVDVAENFARRRGVADELTALRELAGRV